MMKICFIYLGQQGGGVSIEYLEYAVGLSRHAKILCVLSNKSDDYSKWVEKTEANDNVQIFGISTTKNAISGGLQMLNLIKFHTIRKRINAFSPDVIYSPMGHPWERVVVPFLKCKFTIKSIHDVRNHKGENTFFARLVKYLFSYKSSKYVVFSEYSKCELSKVLDERQIWVLPLGCTNSLSHDKRLDLTFYGRFLFFGRLIEYKGVDVLLESLDKVFLVFPNVKLVLAGRGDLSKYQDLLVKHKDRIEIHNDWIQNDEIDSYFRNVDFVVAPYIDASQSGVVTLSYVFGKPVIVSNSGGLPEQVVDGKSGVIIEAGDEDALAQAIISFYKDECKLKEKKRFAYSMSSTFTWDHTAKMLYGKIQKYLNTIS